MNFPPAQTLHPSTPVLAARRCSGGLLRPRNVPWLLANLQRQLSRGSGRLLRRALFFPAKTPPER